MGNLRHLYKALALLCLIALKPALAADPLENLNFTGRYDFDFSGIHLGSLVFSVEEGQDNYSIHTLIRSEGIVNLFTRHTSDTHVNGRKEKYMYYPIHYESNYKTKDKPRYIELMFNKKNEVIKEVNIPPEDRNDRPEVPHALKDGSYDPLSGLMLLRAGVTKLRAFDVKRLYEVTITPNGRSVLRLPVGKRQADAYILTRRPLGGMTLKEMKEYNKGEPPLTLSFSADANRIPLAMSMPVYFGRVEGLLAKECKTWDECVR